MGFTNYAVVGCYNNAKNSNGQDQIAKFMIFK